MAWLSIHSGQEADAKDYVEVGLELDPGNYHLARLSQRLGMALPE
jgi:hypothetical protein